MARRSARRTYARDARGRFASTGTTTAKAKPAARRAQRGTNRIARDNSGRITGVGKNGATARGGRLRTGAGNQRGAVLERVKKRQSPSGAIKATDVSKAKASNYMSKMVEKNQARYDKAAIARGNFPVAENATRRRLAAQSRIANQDRAKPVARPQGRKPVPIARSTRAIYRTRAQAIRAQRARTNTLGKATAAKRGFNEAAGKRSGFADSAPRTVISRPKVSQLSLSGRVERVGAGRFRTVGERLGGGSIRRSRSKPGPIRGSKAWKRQLNQAIKANSGKDVAAFRF